MNPDVNPPLSQVYSDLQLQFLQQLRITPLQTQLCAAAAVADVAAAPAVPAIEAPAWQLAGPTLPLVQDLLQLLQQAGVTAQWFYTTTTTEVQLTPQGLFSAPPDHYQQAGAKQALWQQLWMQLPETGADPDPVETL